MIELVKVVPSHLYGKKFDAHFRVDGREKVVPFGAAGMDDYTKTKDDAQKARYRERHKNDNLNDPTSAGSLSWWILWSAPTFQGGVKNYRRHFGI